MKSTFGCKLKKFTAMCLVLLLLAVYTVPCLSAGAQGERNVLRVAFPQSEGYTMTAPGGERYGLVVDFLNEIAKYTGWEYEYVDVPNDELIDRFGAGEIDLMGGQYYIEGQEANYGYPDYHCGYSKLLLMARQSDESIKYYDISSLNGKTIGVLDRAHENIRRLQIYLDLNNLNCELKYYNYEQISKAGSLDSFLKNGEVDLLLCNSATLTEDEFVVAASFDSQPHYIVTQPNRSELLEQLNMALRHIYESTPDFAQNAYEKNFAEVSNRKLQLTEQEKDFVRQKQTVTVAVPYDWHPLFCLNNEESHDGLVPDVLQIVSEYSGLNFTYLYCDKYADSVTAVQRGEADIMAFFLGTNEDVVSQNLALTIAYADMNAILVRNKESSYPADGLTAAVLEGQQLPTHIHAESIIYYPDMPSALSAINRGKADFFYGVAPRLENVIQQNNFTNLVQVNLVNDSQTANFAMTSPVAPELLSIMNKAIGSMTLAEKSKITSRNIVSIGNGNRHMSLRSIINANPMLALTVVFLFLTLIIVVIIIVSKSRLNAVVIRNELEKAKTESRVKSEFLSRMSHEIRTPLNAVVGLTELTELTEDLSAKAKLNLLKIKSSSQYLLSLVNDILDTSRIENGKMEIARDPFSVNSMLSDIETMLTQEAKTKKLDFRLEKKVQHDNVVGDEIRLRQIILNLLSNAFKFTPAGGTVSLKFTEDSSTENEVVFSVEVTDTGIGISEEDQQRIFKSFEQLGSNYSKSQGTGLGLSISKNLVRMMGGELKLKSTLHKGSTFYFSVTLPQAHARDTTECKPEIEKTALQNVCILVAEDNDLNAEITMELLGARGASVIRAKDGQEAFDLFEKSAPGTFSAILMDIMMPEMNGLEATKAIRALRRADAGSIPIIAMTANAFEKDRQSAFEAGMNGFVSKPIDINALYSALRNAIRTTDSNPD